MNDNFKRNELLLGKEMNDKVQAQSVFICGCGGVGGYAIEAIARMGVKQIILCDNDVISESNINRQIIASESVIGKSKVNVFKERIRDINPSCIVIEQDMFLTKDNINMLDRYHIDFIVDAIDTISSKLELIKYAKEKNIDMISSLGMGNRLDPSLVSITTLNKTENDPLAKVLRQLARKEGLDLSKIRVVCSKELPTKIEDEDNTISSMMPVPAVAGIYCAYEFLETIKKRG